MSVETYSTWGLRGSVGGPGGHSSNPLVVGAVDTTTPFSGTRLLEDGYQLSEAIRNGDWVTGGMAAFAAVGDGFATIVNPIGTLVSWAVGWVLDHIDPLKTWLNKLTGDAGAVLGAGGTWNNISKIMHEAAGSLRRSVNGTLESDTSETVDLYKLIQGDTAEYLAMIGTLASAISTGLQVASTIVQVVHDLVRDAIGDIVGFVASNLIPTPKVIADVSALAAKWASRLGTKVKNIISSVDAFSGLMRKVDDLMRGIERIMHRLKLNAARGADSLGLPPIVKKAFGLDAPRTYTLPDGTPYKTIGAPEQLPRTRLTDELLAKHGFDADTFRLAVNAPIDEVGPVTLSRLKALRDDLPVPDGALMQKALSPGSLDNYMSGKFGNNATGFNAVAGDTSHFRTPADYFEGLRLDYRGTPFDPTGQSTMQVVRYTTGDGFATPYGPAMGGARLDDPPFTGTGFTGSSTNPIPEYVPASSTNAVRMSSAEIWDVAPDGSQVLAAVQIDSVWTRIG